MMEQHQAAAVISPDFCSPLPATLAISERNSTLSDEKYVVKDVNDNVRFRVVETPFSLRPTRVILDDADRPIVTLQKKIFSIHNRWKVFRGKSSDPKDLIFSTKISSLFQFSTKLHIFLASNETQNVCDYALKPQGQSEGSCVIYAGDSDSDSDSVAQMKRESDKLMVSMNPNVDCAFIVALIIIFEEIESQRRRSSTSSHQAHVHAHHQAHLNHQAHVDAHHHHLNHHAHHAAAMNMPT